MGLILTLADAAEEIAALSKRLDRLEEAVKSKDAVIKATKGKLKEISDVVQKHKESK